MAHGVGKAHGRLQGHALPIPQPQADMRITVKEGDELTRYESQGRIGEGQGVKAGSAYRLPDGRMIYVPEA